MGVQSLSETIEKIIKLGQRNGSSKINLTGSRRVLVENIDGGIEEFLIFDDLLNGGVTLCKISNGSIPTIFLRETEGGEFEVIQSGHMIMNETCVKA